MASVLMVSNGTTLLRHGITALRTSGYRVTLYNTTNARDLRRSTPDLVILAADTPRIAFMLLTEIRDDAALHDLPMVMVGGSRDVFAPLPIGILPRTFLLSEPSDGDAVRDAVQAYCPAASLHRLDHGSAVA
jgi:hypothetical protein